MATDPQRQVGWADPDTLDFFCLACAPTPGDVNTARGLSFHDARTASVPVTWALAVQLQATCVVCGRRLPT